MRRRRYGRVCWISEEDNRMMDEAIRVSSRYRHELRHKLLRLLEQVGLERFVARLLFYAPKCAEVVERILEKPWSSPEEVEFAPDPRLYPELQEKLERLRDTGWLIEGLWMSRVGGLIRDSTPRLRVELPLNANLEDYLPAMQAYQEYFQSLQESPNLVEYLADEHGRGRTYSDLADELNRAIIAWAKGEATPLDDWGLDAFLRRRGFTREEVLKQYDELYGPYDDEKVRLVVRNYWTGR